MQFWKLYNYSTYQVPFKDFSKDLIPFLDVSDEEGVEIVEYDVVVPTLGKASENMIPNLFSTFLCTLFALFAQYMNIIREDSKILAAF